MVPCILSEDFDLRRLSPASRIRPVYYPRPDGCATGSDGTLAGVTRRERMHKTDEMASTAAPVTLASAPAVAEAETAGAPPAENLPAGRSAGLPGPLWRGWPA